MPGRDRAPVSATMSPNHLAYTDEGKRLPVVFIHAFPLTRLMWAPQASFLRNQFRVITVDLRGHGESDPISASYTIDDMASDVITLLDRLSIRQAVLGGLSMGGYVLFACYRRFADRFKGLVLADTRSQPDDAEGRAGRFSMIQTAESKGAGAIADLMLPKLLSPASLETRPELVQHLRSMIEHMPVSTIIGDLKAMADRPDSTPLLGTITCPTLVLVGELDCGTPPSDARRIADGIPKARMHVISGAGHLSNLEQPQEFNRTLRSFLETIG
jgi:3-oxoadipate enol-lactonase